MNILVGPNGSGKTNIIMFFQFLVEATQGNLSNAVAKLGGAGALFKKINDHEFLSEFSASISGKISRARSASDKIYKYFYYKYDFRVTLSEDRSSIYFSHQRLRFYATDTSVPTKDLDDKAFRWDFDIRLNAEHNSDVSIELSRIDKRKVRINERYRRINSRKFTDYFSDLFWGRFRDQTILSFPPGVVWQFNLISRDFYWGDVLNIEPAAIKRAEDSAKPPGIRTDGSGLAPTLLTLKRLRDDNQTRVHRHFYGPKSLRAGQRTFDQVVRYLKLVNASVTSLDVQNDPFDNLLKVIVQVKTSDGEAALPFSLMSDGTLKWLSLITAVLTYRSLCAVEERCGSRRSRNYYNAPRNNSRITA